MSKAAYKAKLRQFWQNEAGATAIEYGLVAAIISVGILAAMTVAGGGVANLYGAVSDRTGKSLTDAGASL